MHKESVACTEWQLKHLCSCKSLCDKYPSVPNLRPPKVPPIFWTRDWKIDTEKNYFFCF